MLAAAGLLLGLQLGSVLALSGRSGAMTVLLIVIAVVAWLIAAAVCWSSTAQKSLSDRLQITILGSLVGGPLVTDIVGGLFLVNAYGGASNIPTSILGSLGGLGFVLLGLVGGFQLVQEMGQQHTRKNALAKLEDGERLRKNQSLKDAEEKMREGLLELELAFGSQDPDTAKAAYDLGTYFSLTGEPEKAAAMYKRALQVYEVILEPNHPSVGVCLYSMGLMELKNDADSAMLLLRRALTVRSAQDPNSLETALTMSALSEALSAKEKHAEAEEMSRKAVAIVEKLGHPDYMLIAAKLAAVQVKLGKYSEAEKVLQKVMSEREKATLPEDGELVNLLVESGRVQTNQNKPEAAQKHYLRALNVLRRSVGPEHPLRQEIFDNVKSKMVDIENPPPDYEGALTALLAGDTMAWRKHTDATPGIINMADGTGYTPLQWAVFLSLDRMIEGLLFAGAEVAPAEGSGMPPLLIAARWGNRKALQQLILKGADLNQQDTNGWTALHCVSASGDERTIEPLIGKNADLSVVDREGYTPLHVACIYGSTRVAVEMISRGAKIDMQAPPTMQTPLHLAAQKGNTAVAECLAFNGADLTLKDSNGKTAADLAATSGHHEIVKFFSKQQAALQQHQTYEQKQQLKAQKEKEKAAAMAQSGKQKTTKKKKAKADG